MYLFLTTDIRRVYLIGNFTFRTVETAMTSLRKLVSSACMLCFMLGLQIFLPSMVTAQSLGDLIVSPTRVVFEGRTRSAKVSLSNRGSESAVFRISFVEMTMTPDGQLKRVENPQHAEMVASSMIRYAPRQIEIKPGATQVIRLSLRRPSDLADGEYRSHLYFRAVPPESTGRSISEDSDGNSGGLQIELIPIFGVSIPVIVRNGDLSASADVSKVQLLPESENGPLRLDLWLTRTGERSTFGDINATYRASDGADPVVIGQISRLAVYTNIKARQVILPLILPDGLALSGGTIDVIYQALEEDGGAVLGSSSVAVQ